MNLQTHIRTELWQAISDTYEANNYSHAILDAMHYMSDILRSKTNIDGDGVSLVGQALGGNTPRLRVNKLQTETERNIQKGLEQMLRGLYLAIRNPRSHELGNDTKEKADSIIYFINYILSFLDQSEEPFTVSGFLKRVFDRDFVESERYAELLADEIPANKRSDTLIEIYRNKNNGEGQKLRFIVKAILAKLSDAEVDQFLAVVSDELKTTQNETDISLTLEILMPELWPRISEAARLRTENKLIRSIEEGEVYLYSDEILGTLGSWATDYVSFFSLKEELSRTLLKKMEDDDADDRRFVATFFMSVLPSVVIQRYQISRFVRAISKAIRNGDTSVRQELLKWVNSFPNDWQTRLVENLKDLTDPDNPEYYLPDGTPFLTAQIKDDDIPF